MNILKIELVVCIFFLCINLTCASATDTTTTQHASKTTVINIALSTPDESQNLMFTKYHDYALSKSNLDDSFRYEKVIKGNTLIFTVEISKPSFISINFKDLYIEPADTIYLDYKYFGKNNLQAPIETFKILGSKGFFFIDRDYQELASKCKNIIFRGTDSATLSKYFNEHAIQEYASDQMDLLFDAYPSRRFTTQEQEFAMNYYSAIFYNNILIGLKKNAQEKGISISDGTRNYLRSLNETYSHLPFKLNQYFYSQKQLFELVYRPDWEQNKFRNEYVFAQLKNFDTTTQQFYFALILQTQLAPLNQKQLYFDRIQDRQIKSFVLPYFLDSRLDESLFSNIKGIKVYDYQDSLRPLADILRSSNNRMIYIEFSGSWCAPCRRILDEYIISDRMLEHSDKVKPYWIFFENNLNSWKAIISKYKLPVDNCFVVTNRDLEKVFSENYHWAGEFPHSFLFSRDGKIVSEAAPSPNEPVLKKLIEENF